MSMKPTCHLRFLHGVDYVDYGEMYRKIPYTKLQQLWIDEADGRIQEWRDVEMVAEE